METVRGSNLYSGTHHVHKIHPNEILCNGLSDYASKNEEEECLRNRFFWWRRDLVVLVTHEKQFGIDIGPVFTAPSGEQTLISVVKSTWESIVRAPENQRKCCIQINKDCCTPLCHLFLMHYKDFVSGAWTYCGCSQCLN